MEFPDESLCRISLQSRRLWPRKQISTGHIHAVLRPSAPDKGVLHNTASRQIWDGVFWKAPCNLDQKADSSVSQSPQWEAGRLVGALSAKIAREIGHPCSSPTNDLCCPHQENMSTSNALNYLFKCLETIFGQWHINQMFPEPGVVVYINAVHLGQRSQQRYSSVSVEKWQRKREKEVHRKT